MGAESSTLQSIESLNTTLNEIERKLFIIEDVHLHHERTIAHDNTILVSDKKIQCRAGVSLVVGPIVGAVGTDFARILVETNTDAQLSFNLFVIDERYSNARFISTFYLNTTCGVPMAITIPNLRANTTYAVYIGGINASDALLEYCGFSTLPDLDHQRVRLLMCHHGRIDSSTAGEINLWDDMESIVSDGFDRFTSNERSINFDVIGGTDQIRDQLVHIVIHNGDFLSVDGILKSRAVQILHLITREDSNVSEWRAIFEDTERAMRDAYRRALTAANFKTIAKRCSNIFLAGDGEAAKITRCLLSVKSLLKEASEGPGKLGAEDSAPTAVRGSIAGDSENNSIASALAAGDNMQLDREGYGLSQQQGKDGAVGDGAAATRTRSFASIGNASAKTKRKSKSKSKGSTAKEQLRKPEDYVKPAVGGAVRRSREAAEHASALRAEAEEELRLLVLGMLLRLARRVCYGYMRQLWDDGYSAWLAEDLEKEHYFQAVLQLKKEIEAKKHMQEALEVAKFRVSREFGIDNAASDHFSQRSTDLRTEIILLEKRLRNCALKSNELSISYKPRPNGCCLDLGVVCLLVLEAAWAHIAADDQVRKTVVSQVDIHPEIQAALEDMLTQKIGTGAHSSASASAAASADTTDEGPTEQTRQTQQQRDSAERITAVLCVSSSPLLPLLPRRTHLQLHAQASYRTDAAFLSSGEASGGVGGAGDDDEDKDNVAGAEYIPHGTGSAAVAAEAVHAGYSDVDRKKLLHFLAEWQQEKEERAVLIAEPGTAGGVCAARGVAFPYPVDLNGQELTTEEQLADVNNVDFDKWNSDRSQLQMLVVGQMDRRSRAKVWTMDEIQLRLAHDSSGSAAGGIISHSTLRDTGAVFKVRYDLDSVRLQRSFWDIRFVPKTPPQRSAASSTGWIAGRPAQFELSPIVDSRATHLSILCGPLVGGVTHCSANVLMEYAETCIAELICVDQVTGAEFVCCARAHARRPCRFSFDGLKPNRPYSILSMVPTQSFAGVSAAAADETFNRQRSAVKSNINPSGRDGESSVGSAVFACIGSFTTQRAPFLEALIEAQEHQTASVLRHRSAERSAAELAQRPLSPSLAVPSGFGDLQVGEWESTVLTSNHVGVGADNSLFREVTDATDRAFTSPVRILLLGESRPSWSRVLPAEDPEEMLGHLKFGTDRNHLRRGLELSAEAATLQSIAWNGIDLTVHLGYALDAGSTIDQVLSLLRLSEEAHFSSSSYSLAGIARSGSTITRADRHALTQQQQQQGIHSASLGSGAVHASVLESASISGGWQGSWRQEYGVGSTCATRSQSESFEQQAEECMRNACRYHWGCGGTASAVLAHGNHLFVCSAMLDLLNLFACASLRQLSRELSPFCTERLLGITQRIYSEYQGQLWDGDGASGGGSYSSKVRFLREGSIALFEVVPRLVFSQSGVSGLRGDDLISEAQFSSLAELLFGGQAACSTLLLLSPIPLVLSDALHSADASFLSKEQTGMQYTLRETGRMLDLLADWLDAGQVDDTHETRAGAESHSREVVIVAGGVRRSFTTTIKTSSAAYQQRLEGGGIAAGEGSTELLNGRRSLALSIDEDRRAGVRVSDVHSTPMRGQAALSLKNAERQSGVGGSAVLPVGSALASGIATRGTASRSIVSFHDSTAAAAEEELMRRGGVGTLSNNLSAVADGGGEGSLFSGPFEGASIASSSQRSLQNQRIRGGLGGASAGSRHHRITQVCCGPVVGLFEESLLVSAGVLHTPLRTFTFKHAPQRSRGSGPSVAILEIPPLLASGADQPHLRQQQDSQVSAASSHQGTAAAALAANSSAVAAAAAAAVGTRVAFKDTAGLREFNRYLCKRGVHRRRCLEAPTVHGLLRYWLSLLALRPATASNASNALLTPSVAGAGGGGAGAFPRAAIAGGASVRGGQGIGKAGSADPLGEGADNDAVASEDRQAAANIKQAMGAVFEMSQDVVAQCHSLFCTQQVFTLPTSSGANVELSFLGITHWLVARFPPQFKRICKQPSSLTVRAVWTEMVGMYDISAELSRSSQSVPSEQLLLASLVSDFQYFSSFVKLLIEAQLLLEHLSYSSGLLDG